MAKKKVSVFPRLTRQQGIDWQQKSFSITRQCRLLSLHKSGLYYQPIGESEQNLTLMRQIDEQYLKTPFVGYRLMSDLLNFHRASQGEKLNPKRVRCSPIVGLKTL